MKHLTTLLFIFGLMLWTAHAAAADYDFEIIIFEDLSGRYAKSEQWQHKLPDAGAYSSGLTRAINDDAAANVSKIKGIGLQKYVNALKSSKRYRVLAHKAWRQTGMKDKATVAIPIDSRPAGKSAQTGDKNSINGNIKIVLARYLHIYTDLIYKQPRKRTTPIRYGEEAQRYREYPIKSHRRMRSKELHHLDHPMVGILVMAMPVKTKQKAKDES